MGETPDWQAEPTHKNNGPTETKRKLAVMKVNQAVATTAKQPVTAADIKTQSYAIVDDPAKPGTADTKKREPVPGLSLRDRFRY